MQRFRPRTGVTTPQSINRRVLSTGDWNDPRDKLDVFFFFFKVGRNLAIKQNSQCLSCRILGRTNFGIVGFSCAAYARVTITI